MILIDFAQIDMP